MDRDKDAKLTYDEFVEGSKQDPTIVQVRDHYPSHTVTSPPIGTITLRRIGIAPRTLHSAVFFFGPNNCYLCYLCQCECSCKLIHRQYTHQAFLAHTCLPFTHVLCTYPCLSNTTRSASAPGRSVPFRSSMPKHLKEHQQKSPYFISDSLGRVHSRTLDSLPHITPREPSKIPNTLVQRHNTADHQNQR